MNRITKKIASIALVILGGIVLGYLLIVLVYMIPSKYINKNAEWSYTELEDEGLYPTVILDGVFLDNWTDEDCISVTINTSSSNPFYNALNAFQLSSDGTVGDHSYLWHGFRIWLRVLLLKYNIIDIRCLCFMINIILMIFVCVELVRASNNKYAFIPFAAAYTYFNFMMESLSLLFFNDICVMLIGCLMILWAEKNSHRKTYLEEIYAGIGMLVAFSSMLILPMLTLGFPLIIMLFLEREENHKVKNRLISIIKYSACWFVGYAFTMFSKIVLSAVMIHKDGGFRQVFNYTGVSQHCTLLERLKQIWRVFIGFPVRSEVEFDIAICMTIILLIYIFTKRIKELKGIGKYFPYLFISIYPAVWVFVNTTHAGHGWTYFNFSISIFAVLQVLWEICRFGEKAIDERQ